MEKKMSFLTKLREAFWRYAIRRVDLFDMLPWWAVLLRWVLFPSENFKWVSGVSPRYYPLPGGWILRQPWPEEDALLISRESVTVRLMLKEGQASMRLVSMKTQSGAVWSSEKMKGEKDEFFDE